MPATRERKKMTFSLDPRGSKDMHEPTGAATHSATINTTNTPVESATEPMSQSEALKPSPFRMKPSLTERVRIAAAVHRMKGHELVEQALMEKLESMDKASLR